MKNIIFLLILIVCYGCTGNVINKEKYINKELYDIALGDSCMIYYTVNTCCINCITNEESLDNIKLQNSLAIEEEDKECVGCNIQYAYVVKGIKPGIDTFKIRSVPVPEGKKCKEDTLYIEKYIIRVHAPKDGKR